MRWIIWLVLLPVALVGVIGLIGYLLPVEHVASHSADVSRPPTEVHALLSDLEHYSTWWPGATVESEMVENVAPTRVVTRVVGETQFGGTWTIEIRPTVSGSHVTITERGEVYNVVFRTLSRFVFGHTATMDECLKAMQGKLAAG